MEQEVAGRAALSPVRRPLPWIAIAFAFGIFLSNLASLTGPIAIIGLLAATVLSATVTAASKRPLWLLFTFLSLASTLGFLRFKSQEAVSTDDISFLAPAEVQLTGIVDSEAQQLYADSSAHTKRIRLTLNVTRATTKADERTTENVSGYVDVSIPIAAHEPNDIDESPRYGDEISVSGFLDIPAGPRNPGQLDERTILERQGVYSRLTVRRPDNWIVLRRAGSASGVLKPIYLLKEIILAHGRQVLSRERAGVLNAVLVGAKSELSPANRALFERTGTIHLLATAGLHTGIVVLMLLYLLPFAGLNRRYSIVITLCFLAVYTVMAGDRPAVVRAAVMAAVYLVGMLLEREPNIPNAIATAALALLLANPSNLFDFGFQISFATVITLVLAMKLTIPLQRRITARTDKRATSNLIRLPFRYMVTCLFVTLMAQIGSMPLIAYYFNIFAPAGLIANLLIVPIVPPVIAFGFAAAALGSVSLLLSAPLDALLNFATSYILVVVRHCASPPFGVTSIAPPPGWLVVFYYTGLWGWLGWRRVREQDLGQRT